MFAIDSFQTVVPVTLEGMERYLGSGLSEGSAKVMAERLVSALVSRRSGHRNHPERLIEVEGIAASGASRSRRPGRARASKSDGVPAIARRADLARGQDLQGRYGDPRGRPGSREPFTARNRRLWHRFQTADAIAANLGIERLRPSAARRHFARSRTLSDEGHVALSTHQLNRLIRALLEIDRR